LELRQLEYYYYYWMILPQEQVVEPVLLVLLREQVLLQEEQVPLLEILQETIKRVANLGRWSRVQEQEDVLEFLLLALPQGQLPFWTQVLL
jgi:hypothetical protein